MSEKENPIRAEKRQKLHQLKELGVDPYPHTSSKDCSLQEVQKEFAGLEPGQTMEDKVFRLAGRVLTKRPMGKAGFFDLHDFSGRLQIYIRKDDVPESSRQFYDLMDIGDIVEVKGFVFKSKKGEVTLHAQELRCLCKTLEPLPEKFHGLQDVELKYRYRHLDLITDPLSRKVFATRSRIISEIRAWLNDRGFLEVDTPVLQPIYGGAAAHPFTTHHRALDMTLFLRISPELYLKRLIVGGFEKVYEISKNFRNEGIDRSHNPEFFLLEWYEAYTDYEYQMQQFQDLVVHVVEKIKGSLKFEYQGREIDFSPPWDRISVYEGVKKFTGLDPESAAMEDMWAKAKELKTELKIMPDSRGLMVMELFELAVEPELWHPTFVIDHPIEVSPLTKKHRTHKGLVERFEPFVAGMELGNAYTELNDPEDQLERLRQQEANRHKDEEAHPLDEDFMHAIDVGMPPTGGVGLGIERLVMVLTDRHSIRDILLFPTMRIKTNMETKKGK